MAAAARAETAMEDPTKELADKIASAERERTVWDAGRKAFRTQGVAALNPHSPHSADHALWADGLDAERERMKASQG